MRSIINLFTKVEDKEIVQDYVRLLNNGIASQSHKAEIVLFGDKGGYAIIGTDYTKRKQEQLKAELIGAAEKK